MRPVFFAWSFGMQVSTPEVIRLTGAAETSSEHPLGRALVAFARLESEGFLGQPDEFVAESGKGLQCKARVRALSAGSLPVASAPPVLKEDVGCRDDTTWTVSFRRLTGGM